MSNLSNASLVLKSYDAICDTNRLNITWNNINLRTVLGDMYDKYDTFNICLNTVSTANASANTGTANDDRNVIMSLTGLPWINQTYNTAYLTNTASTVLCTYQFASSATTTQYFYSNNLATFGKNQELVNLTLSYTRIVDNAQPTTANPFPHVVLIFDIFGIDETKHDITSHRMKSIK
jgi:hypothetical protein